MLNLASKHLRIERVANKVVVIKSVARISNNYSILLLMDKISSKQPLARQTRMLSSKNSTLRRRSSNAIKMMDCKTKVDPRTLRSKRKHLLCSNSCSSTRKKNPLTLIPLRAPQALCRKSRRIKVKSRAPKAREVPNRHLRMTAQLSARIVLCITVLIRPLHIKLKARVTPPYRRRNESLAQTTLCQPA